MSLLDTFTQWMINSDKTGKLTNMPDIPDHRIQLTRFLINSQFKANYSLEEIEKLLYEEGLLPNKYYFSDWYIDKWGAHTKTPEILKKPLSPNKGIAPSL